MRKRSRREVNLSLPQQRYVETISELIRTHGRACTCDLARRLDVRMPSVSEAVSRLVAAGIVKRQSRHDIALTKAGEAVAAQMERRQAALRRFMVEVLGMAAGEADGLACRLEHEVDRTFVDRLVRVADFLGAQHGEVLRAVARHAREEGDSGFA